MQKNSYNYDELISCGEGKLFGEGNAKLPLPPMLMFDRITEIKKDAGEFKKGFIKAELDIKDNLWFFDCHFQKRPGNAWMFRIRCHVAISWLLLGVDWRTRKR